MTEPVPAAMAAYNAAYNAAVDAVMAIDNLQQRFAAARILGTVVGRHRGRAGNLRADIASDIQVAEALTLRPLAVRLGLSTGRTQDLIERSRKHNGGVRMEPMLTYIEVWPVTADEAGLSLASGIGAWLSTVALMDDDEPHAEAELLLANHGVNPASVAKDGDVVWLHSTGWRRVRRLGQIDVYIAVLARPDIARASWPQAAPIGRELAEAVGPAPPHGATDPPVVRDLDVLMHGLRHLRHELDANATTRAAFADAGVLDVWLRHIGDLRPALAGMYQTEYRQHP